MTNGRFPPLPAPLAKQMPVTDTRHGIERTDAYGWMRAGNWQDVFRDPTLLDTDIRSHLEAENAYQKAMLADVETLRKTLFGEMKGRIKQDDSSVPAPDGDWSYGVKYVTGGEQPRYVRTPRDGGDEQLLLDGDAEAAGKSYFRLAGAAHAPNHATMAWSYDDKGSEFFKLRFRDLASGRDGSTVIANSGGSATWANDSRTVFYTRLDENHRPSKIMRHTLDSDPANDTLVYEETDPGFFMGVGKTQSNRFLVLDIHDHETSEVHLIDADAPESAPRLIATRATGLEYAVDEAHGTLYILTNADSAKDFKIVTAPVDNPGRENWTDLIAHEPGRLILNHSVYANHLTWLERRDGLPRIVVMRLADGAQHVISFDEEAYSLGLSGSNEFDTTVIRFSYSSMTTPSQLYDYDMEGRERTLLKTQEVPSGHDVDRYVTRRLMVASHDGEQVPVSILHHRDFLADGTAPCLLYGYGSYGMSIPAAFNTNCLSLVDRGFVYAIAHIRGGKDKGYAWYEAGRREHKANTFKDFIAVARHLADTGYSAPDRIVAQGGSAGGMLMGAAANMAPDAFGGIIAEVPFVDVLNTMLDDTLPLTPPEWPEWGNPIASAADYAAIAAYSPYDNVRAQAYPPILAVAGLTDPRVTYWEPAKWVARLRAAKTDGHPVLLRTNMDAGHGGASGRFSRLEEVALNYAFALKVVGLADDSA
jgi:oligopeptidase B